MSEKTGTAIRIGLVEEFHGETDLILRELKDSEMHFVDEVVRGEAAFLQMLNGFRPDVVLSPYSLKDTNAVKLLTLARKAGFDMPFILLAFDLSEDIAIDLLAEGIEDYVQRSTLKRLPVAIRKALQRHQTQLELQLSEGRLRASESALRNMVRNAPIAVAMFDADMNYLVVSETWLTLEEKTENIIGKNHYEVVPEIPEHWKLIHKEVLQGETKASENETIARADGSSQTIRWKMNPWFTSDRTVGGAVLFIEDISEAVKTKEQLEKTAESLAIAQNIAKVGSWTIDSETQAVQWSDEMFVIHGIKKQPLTVTLIRNLTHEEDLHLFDGAFEALMSGTTTNLVYRIIQPNTKAVRHVRGIGRIIMKADGTILDVSGTVQDITDTIITLGQIEKDQRLLAIGEELGGTGSFEFDLATQTARWSDNMYKIKGIEPSADISYENYIKHVHPEDKDKYLDGYSKIMESVAPTLFEYRLIRPDNGKVVHLRVHSSFVNSKKGEPIALMGSVQDISAIKETQESLTKSEASLKAAQKIAKVGSWEWTKGAEYVEVSAQMYEIYEIENRNLTIEDIRSFIHPDDKKRVAKEASNDFNKDIKPVIEYRIITGKGNLKYVVTSAKQVLNKQGEVIQLIGILQDVTEKVEVEMKSKAEQVQRELALQASKVGVWHWLIDSNELVWDDRCFEIFGKEPYNLSVEDFMSFVHPKDREQLQGKIAEAMLSGEYKFDYRIDANGKEKHLHGRAKATYNNEGLPVRLDGIIIDNTELKQG